MKIKDRFNNTKISMISVLLATSFFITVLSVLAVGYFWHKTVIGCYNEKIRHITDIYIKNAKDYSKYMVDNIVKEIREDINYTYTNVRKEKQVEFYNAIRRLYDFRNIKRGKFLLFAKRYLSLKTFKSDLTYYIFDLKGRCLLNPFDKHVEGKSLLRLEDENLNRPFSKLVRLAKVRDAGYLLQNYPYNWYFLQKEYIGRYGFTFFVVFRNYGYIVVGRFDLGPIEYALKQKWIKYLSMYKYGKNNHGYIFVLELEKYPSSKCLAYDIVNPDGSYDKDTCFFLFNKKGYISGKKYFEKINKKGYMFVKYYHRLSGSSENVLKIGYLRLFREWNWIIGTDTYIPDLYNSLHVVEMKDKRELKKANVMMFFVLLLVFFLIFVLYFYVSRFANRKIKDIFKKFESYLSRAEFIDVRPYMHIKQLVWITNSLNNAIVKFRKYEDDLLKSFVGILETRDIYTKGHSQRVAFYAKEMAKTLGFNKEFQEKIYKAGLLHDIGKVGVPDNILLKPGRLSENEYKTIKYHSVISYEILRRIAYFSDIADCVRQHHEKCDGSGYPDGLKCEKIHIEARILAIADIFDALTTTRPYRKAFTPEEAIKILEKESVDQNILRKVKDVLLEISKDRDLTVAEFMSEEIDRIRGEIFKVDYMTGLLFITSFVEKLRYLIKEKRKFVLFAVNIKGIAKINYKFSTEIGNKVIENMAKIIKDYENKYAGNIFACRAYADIFLIAVEIDGRGIGDIDSVFDDDRLSNLLKETFSVINDECKEKDLDDRCIKDYIKVVVDRVVYPDDGKTAEELIYFVENRVKRR